jgi:Putative restriction endonuclease
VCEIISPSNAAADRVLKMHYYAESGIEWCLLIDPDGPTMQLYHHEDGRYVEHSAGAPGFPLAFPEPISATIDPATLVRGRRQPRASSADLLVGDGCGQRRGIRGRR